MIFPYCLENSTNLSCAQDEHFNLWKLLLSNICASSPFKGLWAIGLSSARPTYRWKQYSVWSISAYRKGQSTITVLQVIRDDILKSMKHGEVTMMVLADFSKAF